MSRSGISSPGEFLVNITLLLVIIIMIISDWRATGRKWMPSLSLMVQIGSPAQNFYKDAGER